jgi:CheY-like chemotaxis protein
MHARILIIEDNPANLELMRYLLDSAGCSIESAMNGQQGVELLHGNLPDMVLCDVQMPVMDGFAVARHMKNDATLRQLPLIAITASVMDQDRSRILAAGFDGYITKPITPESFVAEVLGYMRQDISKGI